MLTFSLKQFCASYGLVTSYIYIYIYMCVCVMILTIFVICLKQQILIILHLGIQEFKYLKKGLDEKFNLDFMLVDVVNKYRDIYYKWQLWETFIKNKEFILSPNLYSRCVMSPPFTSYAIPKINTVVGTQHVQKVKSNLVIR